MYTLRSKSDFDFGMPDDGDLEELRVELAVLVLGAALVFGGRPRPGRFWSGSSSLLRCFFRSLPRGVKTWAERFFRPALTPGILSFGVPKAESELDFMSRGGCLVFGGTFFGIV